ncbi:hypothetical protein DHEL01_v203329 [Diaporthe helianthi]|uniref:Uncharacterized protein n=1 Tax=Diaporthe helianthi TaxID=158607 RepID=A0A2P5I6Y1_DIAHE|nr:hypothetical protein DHEL01_v203329 [Diaporthe helianthi]
MACIMLIFSAITKPARWACSNCCCCCRPGKDDIAPPRDLELLGLEREHGRNSTSTAGRRSSIKRDRSMSHPDEFDVYGNHWDNTSLDCLMPSRSIRVPSQDGVSSWSLDEARDVDELLHPDAFDIITADDKISLAGTTVENTPDVAESEVDLALLVSLQAVSTLELHHSEEGDEEDTGDSKATTVATQESSAPSASPPPFSESLPSWLIARKTTANIRASRFVEVDVDSPDIAPPDFGLIAEQQELLERGHLSVRTRARGMTWHDGQDKLHMQEVSQRAVARRSV